MELSLVLLLQIIGLISRLTVECSEINYEEENSHVFTTVFYKYSERVRPYYKELSPVEVKVSLEIIDIIAIDTKHKQLESIVDLRLTWKDPRLLWNTNKIQYITVNDSTVWTPDVHFLNILDTPQVIIRPRFIIIDRPGNVYQYSRLRIKTGCKGHGNNTCALRLGSNLFTESELIFTDSNCAVNENLLTSDVKFEMKNITGNMTVVEQHVLAVPSMFTPQFSEKNFSVVSCELIFKDSPQAIMEHSKQTQNDDENIDDTNSAKQTFQRLGLLLIGIVLFFIS